MASSTFNELLDKISEIEEERELQDYHAIIFWFLRTVFRMSEKEILDSICDGTRDKGVDAVVLNHIEKHITIIQSKFTADGGATAIRKDDIRRLADVKGYFKSRRTFGNAVGGANPAAARLLEEAYQAQKKKGYTLELVFLSTHKSDSDLETLIDEELGFKAGDFTFYDFQRIMHLYKDFKRDYTPKTGPYNLRYKDEDKVILRKGRVNSWILNVPVEEIRSLVTRFPLDLFRKNVRNFLGISKTNRAIQKTLKSEPESFWYFNNGITILCDQANLNPEKSYIRLANPQVVNGCQTAMSIQKYKGKLSGDVLVRVIQSNDHDFIQSITLSQNTSNPVKARDFKSNDPVQIRLKRELKRKRYYFEIKRGEEYSRMKKEFRSIAQDYDKKLVINNGKVAEFLAAVKINPGLALSKGGEAFFDEYYDTLFDNIISTSDVIAPWSFDQVIMWTYEREKEPFHEFENSYVFKRRAKFYVLTMMYEALRGSGLRQWKKKWATLWPRLFGAEWMRFAIKFDKIASACFETIYRAWKKSGEREWKNYLQNRGTLEEVKQSQTKRWGKHVEKTRELFVGTLKGM